MKGGGCSIIALFFSGSPHRFYSQTKLEEEKALITSCTQLATETSLSCFPNQFQLVVWDSGEEKQGNIEILEQLFEREGSGRC